MDVVENYFEGDALILRFSIVDEFGDPVSLTGVTVEWEVRSDRYSDVLLDVDSDGVDLEVLEDEEEEENKGVFEVDIQTSSTQSIRGNNTHIVRLKDASGNQTTFIGRFVIRGIGPDS